MFEYSIKKYLMPRIIKEILNVIQKQFPIVAGRFLSVKYQIGSGLGQSSYLRYFTWISGGHTLPTDHIRKQYTPNINQITVPFDPASYISLLPSKQLHLCDPQLVICHGVAPSSP